MTRAQEGSTPAERRIDAVSPPESNGEPSRDVLPTWLLEEEQALGLTEQGEHDVLVLEGAPHHSFGEDDLDLFEGPLAGVPVGVLEVVSAQEVRGWLRDVALLPQLVVLRGEQPIPLFVDVTRRQDVIKAFPGATDAVGFCAVLRPLDLRVAELDQLRVQVGSRRLMPLKVATAETPPLPDKPFERWDVRDVLAAAAVMELVPTESIDSRRVEIRSHLDDAVESQASETLPGSLANSPCQGIPPRARRIVEVVHRAALRSLPAEEQYAESDRPWVRSNGAPSALRAALGVALLTRVLAEGKPTSLTLDFSEAVLRALGAVDDDYVAFQHAEGVLPERLLPLRLSPSAPLIASHHAEMAKEASLPYQGVLHPVALTALSPRSWSVPLHPALRRLPPLGTEMARWGDLPPAAGLAEQVTRGPATAPKVRKRLEAWFREEEMLALQRVHDADTDKRRRRKALLAPRRRVLAHTCPDGPPPSGGPCPHKYEDLRFLPGTGHLDQMARVAAHLAASQNKLVAAARAAQRLVSVVLPTRNRLEDLRCAMDSILTQSHEELEVVVVDDGSTDGTRQYLESLDDPRVRWTTNPRRGAGSARNAGAAVARGELLMWMDSDDLFLPGAVAAVAASCPPDGWCYTETAMWDGSTLLGIGEPFDDTRLRFDNYITQLSLGISRAALERAGGYDEALVRAIDYDMILRLLDVAEPVHVPIIGSLANTMHHLPRITTKGSAHWASHVRNRALPAWRDPAAVPPDAPRVSVIIPVLLDWSRAARLVQALRRDNPDPSQTEIVVVDDGLHPQGYAALSAVAAAVDARVVTTVENQGFSIACNTGALTSRGRVLVFLNDDAIPSPRALETLVTHYEAARPAAVQGLSVTDDDLYEGLGIVAGPDGLPYALGTGLLVDVNLSEDVRRLRPQALNAAFLAVGRDDFVALRGFDPLFRNGMEDIDLSLRLALRTGRELHVEPDATIRHSGFGSGQQRKKYIPENRLAFSRRWRGLLRRDDGEAWRILGYEVRGYEVSTRDPITTIMPRPVLQEVAASTTTIAPWHPARLASQTDCIALVIGTPRKHLLTEPWGDTYLAMGLRRVLRERGLRCRVVSFDDPRPAFDCHHLRLDLLGLHAPRPVPGARQAAWVISHPSRLLEADLDVYEHVFVASPTWSPASLDAARSSVLPQPSDLHQSDQVDAAARQQAAGSVVFVGNSRKTIRPCIEYALDARVPLQVYGNGWELLAQEPDVTVSGPVDRLTTLGLYAGARLTLNDHWPDMLLNGFLSNRVADVLAVGGRLATDIPDGMDQRLAGVLPLRSLQEMQAAWHSPDNVGRAALPPEYRMEHTVDALLGILEGLGPR
jgi:glycosyltransferase involved in cell wall biosynthesis